MSEAQQHQILPGYATSPNPSYGQQPLSRVLHIYREGLTHRHARILDSNKRTPLYHIDTNSGGLFSSKPHVKLYVAATGAQVGTITYRQISRDIDMTIHNQPVLLKKAGFLTSAHEFNSLATGSSFKWKRDGMFSFGDMLCLDEREQLVAKFEMSNWAMKKDGKIELSPGLNGVLVDELVISGFAMREYVRKQD